MSKENFYENGTSPLFEGEFDPSQEDEARMDDEGRILRLPQTLGCLTALAAIMATVAIVSCHEVMKDKGNAKEDSQPAKTEEVQEEKVMPKKVSEKIDAFLRSTTFTYSQALRERGL